MDYLRVERHLTNEYQPISDSWEGLSVTLGALTAVACGAVIFTFYMFPSMASGKIFMQMLIVTSICQFFAAVAIFMGFPVSLWCQIQGFCLFFFYRGAWAWMTLMVFQVYYLINYGQIYFRFSSMNLVVWPLNILYSLLPLIYQSSWYGSPSQWYGTLFCSLDINQNHYLVEYVTILFFGPLLLCIVLLLYFCGSLYFTTRNPQTKTEEAKRTLVFGIMAYPALMIVAWLPMLVFFFQFYFVGDSHEDFSKTDYFVAFILFFSWTTFEGFLTAIAFFINSSEARNRWKKYLRNKFGYTDNSDGEQTKEDNRESSVCSYTSNTTEDRFSSILEGFQEDFLADEALETIFTRRGGDSENRSSRSSSNSRDSRWSPGDVLNEIHGGVGGLQSAYNSSTGIEMK